MESTEPLPPLSSGVAAVHVPPGTGGRERALAFRRDAPAFGCTRRFEPEAAFLSAGGRPHHLAPGTGPTPPGGMRGITRPPDPGGRAAENTHRELHEHP